MREKRRENLRQQPGNSEGESTCLATSGFKNKMVKSRALKKTVEALPQTPTKRAELVQTISSSPRTRKILAKKGLLKTPEEVEEMTSLRALAADISESMQTRQAKLKMTKLLIQHSKVLHSDRMFQNAKHASLFPS